VDLVRRARPGPQTRARAGECPGAGRTAAGEGRRGVSASAGAPAPFGDALWLLKGWMVLVPQKTTKRELVCGWSRAPIR